MIHRLYFTAKDKVNGAARQSPTYAGEGALGHARVRKVKPVRDEQNEETFID